MKKLILLAAICSALCIITALIQRDWSEAMAWSMVTYHNTKDYLTFENN